MGRQIEAHLAEAYALAYGLTRNAADAEDAVSSAVVALLSRRGQYDPSRPFAPYFARSVVNAAHDLHRSARARATQEGKVMPMVENGADEGQRRETAAAVREAVGALPFEERAAVLLTHLQGLSQTDAAKALGVSQKTVSTRARRALEKLRVSLAGAGLAGVALADWGATLARGPLPAGLAERVKGLVTGAKTTASASAAASVSAAAKGGIAMKVIAGLVLAGAVAAGVAVMGGGGPEPLPAEKPKRFSTPVSDPGAEWVKEPFVLRWSNGDPLDGPRAGIMYNAVPGAGIFEEGGSDYYFRRYDPDLDRYFTYAGDATGYLDGPISRARINRSGYSLGRCTATSSDGRYLYFTEPGMDGVLRVLDNEKGEIRTLIKDVGGSPGMTADSKGNVYVVSFSGFQVVSPDGKIEKRPLECPQGTLGYSLSLAIDEKNNRLYGGRRDTHVWYWDLAAGGKYVPVLNAATSSAPKRDKCTSGPFDGSNFWCPGGLNRGPDDPGVRFLYFGGGDDNSFYRLDREKKYVHRFRDVKGKKGVFHFGESVKGDMGKGPIGAWCGPPGWGEDGDFYLGDWCMINGIALYRYRRVK